MKHIIFIRHGESVANAEGWIAGRFDAELTEIGRNQAASAAEKLVASNKKIDIIITSPMSRAHDTAEIIAKAIGYPADKIKIDYNLIELEMGKWTKGLRKQLFDDLASGVFPNEYLDGVIDNVRKLLAELKRMPAQNIMLVSHNETGRALLQLIKNPDNPRNASKLPHIKNCDPIYIKI